MELGVEVERCRYQDVDRSRCHWVHGELLALLKLQVVGWGQRQRDSPEGIGAAPVAAAPVAAARVVAALFAAVLVAAALVAVALVAVALVAVAPVADVVFHSPDRIVAAVQAPAAFAAP